MKPTDKVILQLDLTAEQAVILLDEIDQVLDEIKGEKESDEYERGESYPLGVDFDSWVENRNVNELQEKVKAVLQRLKGGLSASLGQQPPAYPKQSRGSREDYEKWMREVLHVFNHYFGYLSDSKERRKIIRALERTLMMHVKEEEGKLVFGITDPAGGKKPIWIGNEEEAIKVSLEDFDEVEKLCGPASKRARQKRRDAF